MSWKGWILLLLVLVLAAVAKPSLRAGGDGIGPSPVPTPVSAGLDDGAWRAQATPPAIVAQDQTSALQQAAGPDPAFAPASEEAREVGRRADAPASAGSPQAEPPDDNAALEAALSRVALSADELAQEKAKATQLQDTLAKTLSQRADWESAAKQATAAAIAEFRRRTQDGAAMKREIAALEQRLRDEQAISASEARDLATAREALARASEQTAVAEDTQHALQVSARDTDTRLKQEQDRSASLAAELTKARATIADLRSQTPKPQADAGPVQVLPVPAPGSGAASKEPLTDGRNLQPQIEAPLPPTRPDPVAERERPVQSARKSAGARTTSRIAHAQWHRPAYATTGPVEPYAVTSPAFSDEGAYSMTMDDSRYDFSDLAGGRVSEARVADSGIEVKTGSGWCRRHACTLSGRQPIHLAKRFKEARRILERRRD